MARELFLESLSSCSTLAQAVTARAAASQPVEQSEMHCNAPQETFFSDCLQSRGLSGWSYAIARCLNLQLHAVNLCELENVIKKLFGRSFMRLHSRRRITELFTFFSFLLDFAVVVFAVTWRIFSLIFRGYLTIIMTLVCWMLNVSEIRPFDTFDRTRARTAHVVEAWLKAKKKVVDFFCRLFDFIVGKNMKSKCFYCARRERALVENKTTKLEIIYIVLCWSADRVHLGFMISHPPPKLGRKETKQNSLNFL